MRGKGGETFVRILFWIMIKLFPVDNERLPMFKKGYLGFTTQCEGSKLLKSVVKIKHKKEKERLEFALKL